MKRYKKSFSLLITLFLVSIFSVLSIYIVELNHLSTTIDTQLRYLEIISSSIDLILKATQLATVNIDAILAGYPSYTTNVLIDVIIRKFFPRYRFDTLTTTTVFSPQTVSRGFNSSSKTTSFNTRLI